MYNLFYFLFPGQIDLSSEKPSATSTDFSDVKNIECTVCTVSHGLHNESMRSECNVSSVGSHPILNNTCTVEPFSEVTLTRGHPLERPRDNVNLNVNVLISTPDERSPLLKSHFSGEKMLVSQEGFYCIIHAQRHILVRTSKHSIYASKYACMY